MKPKITAKQIKPLPDAIFEVTVADLPAQARGNGDETVHTVHVEEEYIKKLLPAQADGWEEEDIEKLIERSFVFLLEREPKESILREFNLRDIARYFPEFEKEFS